jgi:hypothetical protein
MNIEDQETSIQTAMMQHLEDAANLCRQLPERGQPYYLRTYAEANYQRGQSPQSPC